MGVVLVTGSSGLVGSECVRHFAGLGRRVVGLDSNARMSYFGGDGDTGRTLARLCAEVRRFDHHAVDVRDAGAVAELVGTLKPDIVIHCAAQPSHDWATRRPVEDFSVNAVGTLNLLE